MQKKSFFLYFLVFFSLFFLRGSLEIATFVV